MGRGGGEGIERGRGTRGRKKDEKIGTGMGGGGGEGKESGLGTKGTE
jgi:hypothetical protein